MLTSVYFIKAKVENSLCLQLLEDLHLNIPNNPSPKWMAKKKEFLADCNVKDVGQFISKNLDVLGK